MEFDIAYFPQKAIKGRRMVEFLAKHPVPENSSHNTELPDEKALMSQGGVEQTKDILPQQEHDALIINLLYWDLYFDGASRKAS